MATTQTMCAPHKQVTGTTGSEVTPGYWRDLTTDLEGLPLPHYRQFPYPRQAAPRRHMRSYHQFPSKHRLLSLACAAQFPATSTDMIAFAERRGCNRPTILFLQLFGLQDVFENGIDFLNRCEEVKLFLREERNAPYELLRSSED